MRVLHLGGTGNLGRRVIGALLAHGHVVVALVRSRAKLLRILGPTVSARITVVEGDAMDSSAIAAALRAHACDAVVNTAGTREPRGHEQTLPLIVAAATSAAVRVGAERGGEGGGAPLRAWLIGGLGSLPYPGTGYRVQDYLPLSMTEHMRGVEAVVRGIGTGELRWSLLCVAMMRPADDDGNGDGGARRPGNGLLVAAGRAPGWRDHWVRRVPFVGEYLNLLPVIRSFTTEYEEVADLIAADLAGGGEEYVGQLVGFKASEGRKDL